MLDDKVWMTLMHACCVGVTVFSNLLCLTRVSTGAGTIILQLVLTYLDYKCPFRTMAFSIKMIIIIQSNI
jgi:hypothetical protein